MNWPRIILDGISMSLLFNAVVLIGFTIWPQEYSVMFPKEIKEAAAGTGPEQSCSSALCCYSEFFPANL